MAQSKFVQMLLDNGFSYHTHPNYKSVLVIENIRILEMFQQITSVEVSMEGTNFCIQINLKDDYLYSEDGELNLYIDLSMYVCIEMRDNIL